MNADRRRNPGLSQWLTAALLLLAEPLFAEENVTTPEAIDGVTRVNSEQLIELLDTTSGKLLMVDSRITMDRRQGFIEGSVSLPDVETSCETLEVIIPTSDTATLFYCNGPKCGRSAKAIYKALACGYNQLYWFRGGFEEWSRKGYPVLKP